jgi:hypothetical protein
MSTFNLAVTGLTQWDATLWLLRAAGIAVAMLVLAMALRRWRMSAERDAQRMFEQLDLLRSELLLMHERLDSQPQSAVHAAAPEAPVAARAPQYQSPQQPQYQNEQRNMPLPSMPAPRGYEVAVRLARSGATVDELISSCGLSRNEAQLVLRLHCRQEPPVAVKREAQVVDAKVRVRGSESPPRGNASANASKELPSRARLSMAS